MAYAGSALRREKFLVVPPEMLLSRQCGDAVHIPGLKKMKEMH